MAKMQYLHSVPCRWACWYHCPLRLFPLSFSPFISLLQLLRDVLNNEGREVVHLADGDALLAENVVSSGEVEVDVGQSVAVEVSDTREGDVAARAETKRHRLGDTAVDESLVSVFESLLGLFNAGVDISKGLEVLELGGRRLKAAETSDDLESDVGNKVHLEVQGQHVGVDAGLEQAVASGGGLTGLDDVCERGESLLGLGDRDFVQ